MKNPIKYLAKKGEQYSEWRAKREQESIRKWELFLQEERERKNKAYIASQKHYERVERERKEAEKKRKEEINRRNQYLRSLTNEDLKARIDFLRKDYDPELAVYNQKVALFTVESKRHPWHQDADNARARDELKKLVKPQPPTDLKYYEAEYKKRIAL